MKKVKFLIFLAAALCALAVFAGKDTEQYSLPKYIMHAGGTLEDGTMGTNSVEAMDRSYDSGLYWMEIDFIWTSDDQLVCVHDWQSRYSYNLTGVYAPDLELFESMRKTTYGYESHTLDSLVKWMREHPEAVIVTDIKENNLKAVEIISKYDDMRDRFAIQIYHPDEYETVAKLGFDKIILTVYQLTPQQIQNENIVEWISSKNEKLIACTVPSDPFYSDMLSEIKETGIPVYIHTVNDAQEQKMWLDSGICGVYCDVVQ